MKMIAHQAPHGRLTLLALALCGALSSPPVPLRAVPAETPDVRRDATVLAVEQVMPSVVNIATATVMEYHDFYENLLREFYGLNPPARREERLYNIGSGVIIDEEGYIVTNLHVLRRASRVEVKLSDGREYEAEPIVATPYSDVALLKITRKPGEKPFRAVKFAADDDLFLGETVVALGNPFGLGGTVTKGILSSKSRRPPTGTESLNVKDWLQTDAAINPGNSGGPLINLRGELIGLNVAVGQGQGIGFAIPVKQVADAISRFFSPEVTHSLWFGARVNPDTPRSVLSVTFVQAGSPADKAGLREGDQILQVNGRPADNVIEFNRLVAKAADHQARLLVKRGGTQPSINVRLVPFEELIQQKLGATLLELTEQTAARLGVEQSQGLFVEEVEKGGPAERAKLQRGYLLTAMDGQAAKDLMTAAAVLSTKKKGESVRLTVLVPQRLGASYVAYRQGSVDVQVR
jgi:S1-C subfamily serine protease